MLHHDLLNERVNVFGSLVIRDLLDGFANSTVQ